MKEIKAYIRLDKAEDVIHALEKAGVPGLTAIEVKAIGTAVDTTRARYSLNYIERVSPITKLEVVCRNEEVERLVDVITKKACTGRKGDGIIFVSDVNTAVKIRTGERGEGALLPAPEKGSDCR